MKTFLYFFEKANLQLNDDVLNKFDLNFKKTDIEITQSIKGLHNSSGVLFKYNKSTSHLKFEKEKQTWNEIAEIDGIKLYIGWYNDEFEEITTNLIKLEKEVTKTTKHVQYFNYTALDNNTYKVPLLLFLPKSLQYNNKGTLEKTYSKRYKFLVDIADKYFGAIIRGEYSCDNVEIYHDISIIMGVFYNINKYDILYSGIFDEISIAEFFEEALTIDLLVKALDQEKEAKDLAEKKS